MHVHQSFVPNSDNTTKMVTAKIEGDMLTLSGVGNPWNEVWKRLNEAKPLQLNRAVPEQVIESTVTLE